MRNEDKPTTDSKDNYAYGMDWGEDKVSIGDLGNYRQYQYDLVGDYVGREILEVGCGASRSFTKQILKSREGIQRLLSIEPSEILIDNFSQKGAYEFPEFAELKNIDIFDLDQKDVGLFDTVFFIHVLEHIEDDRRALDCAHKFLKDDGHVLVEVPALPFLYSDHDKALGHYRRYTKKMLRAAVDEEKYRIHRIWYNDPIGILGSLIFFKLRKIKLNSQQGIKAVESQGMFYDKYLIPLQAKIERLITFPVGLNLTVVLGKI